MPTTAGSVALENCDPGQGLARSWPSCAPRARSCSARPTCPSSPTSSPTACRAATRSLGGQVLNPYNADITPSGSQQRLRRRRGRRPGGDHDRHGDLRLDRLARRRRRGSSACGPRSASCQPHRHRADQRHAGHGRPDDADRRRRGRRARRDRRQGPGGPGHRLGARDTVPDYLARRSRPTALAGKRIGVINNTNAQYVGGGRRDPGARRDDGRRSATPSSRGAVRHPHAGVQARPQRVPGAAARERADEDARGHHRLQHRPRRRRARSTARRS